MAQRYGLKFSFLEDKNFSLLASEVNDTMEESAIPLDYDTNPARFRANVASVEQHGLAADVHPAVAQRLASAGLAPILDVGCGEGRLVQPVRAMGLPLVAFDYSATMLAAIANPRVRGDGRRLPFQSHTFGGVAALYMLYHIPNPKEAIAESYRVLQPGGLFIACAPSRFNDPELAAVLPFAQPETFDAENGPVLVQTYFPDMDVERWDAPLVHLPNQAALVLYLQGRGLAKDQIEAATTRISLPLTLTKRGALIIGRKRS